MDSCGYKIENSSKLSSAVYSPEFIDAMFAEDDLVLNTTTEIPAKEESHILPIFETIAKGSQDVAAARCSVALNARTGEDGLSAAMQGTVLVAVPASALESGLTPEQLAEGFAKMKLIAELLTPENLAVFKSYLLAEATAAPAEDDSVRFPIFENGRCNDKKCWKRLRAKRGFAYFTCLQCGLKWRATTLSEKLKKQSQPHAAAYE